MKASRLELREALEIAIQIAAALEAAHKAGIVHRDIKPENVMLRDDGYVKVLDFGLAKLSQRQTPDDDRDRSLAASSTEEGVMMGTPRYMSPEQARGLKVDERTDIFSLGVVLYEMIAGQTPFAGETTADLIAALLSKEPEMLSLRVPGAPDELERIVRKALAKDRQERYQTAKDLQLDLKALQQTAELNAPLARPHPVESQTSSNRISIAVRRIQSHSLSFLRQRRWSIATGGVLAMLLITAAVWQFLYRSSTLSESSLRASLRISELLNLPNRSGSGFSGLSFSPNGQLIAYSLSDGEEAHIWIKQVAGGDPTQVTKGKYQDTWPVWSSDGQELAFFSNRGDTPGIWTMPYLGGTPKLFSSTNRNNIFLTGWSQNKQTIYYEYTDHNLYAIDRTSGQSSRLTNFDPKHPQARHFKVSPDEKYIAYAGLIDKKYRILVRPMGGGEAKPVTNGEGGEERSPTWFPDGKRIAYSSKRDNIYQICLAWLDGREPLQITFSQEDHQSPIVSPDGAKIMAISSKANADLYSWDLQTGRETKQTSEFKLQLSPEISPDGERIAFQATKSTLRADDHIIIQSLTANRQPNQLASGGFNAKWSPVGSTLAFLHYAPLQAELRKVSASGRDETTLTKGVVVPGMTMLPFNYLDTCYNWSPDGSKIAYFSEKSGQRNLWVVASDRSSDVMISNNSDPKLELTSPFWSPQQDRIAYVSKAGENRNICVTERGKTETVYEYNKPLRIIGWSPSGKEVIVALAEGKGLVFPQEISLGSVSIETRKLRLIARIPAVYLHNIKLSRDGIYIAFVSREDRKDNIKVIPTKGGSVRKISSNTDPTTYYSSITWSPSRKMLFYSKQASWTLISIIENIR
jgi:Tol biopolymer transport system component